jgi:hypothetical protein
MCESYYNYEEALSLIEQFMKKSKIREYCTRVCKGACCRDCYTSENACHLHEGRRLACSNFLCVQLIHFVFPKVKDRNKHEAMKKIIHDALRKANTSSQYRNPYFQPYTLEQLRNFRIRKPLFDKYLPSKVETEKISLVVDNLINTSVRF